MKIKFCLFINYAMTVQQAALVALGGWQDWKTKPQLGC